MKCGALWLWVAVSTTTIVLAETSGVEDVKPSDECKGIKRNFGCLKGVFREYILRTTVPASSTDVLVSNGTDHSAIRARVSSEQPPQRSTASRLLQLRHLMYPWLQNLKGDRGRTLKKKEGLAMHREASGKLRQLARQGPGRDREMRTIRLILLVKLTMLGMGIFLVLIGIKKFLILLALLYKWSHHHKVEYEYHPVHYHESHDHDHGHSHGHHHHGHHDPYWSHGHETYKRYSTI